MKVVLKTLSGALAAAAPWIFAWAATKAGAKGPPLTEDQKVWTSLVAVLLVGVWDLVEFYLPREQLRRFGKEYCDKLAKTLRERPAPFPKLGTDIRLNVMYARGFWVFSWFKWVANYGYTDDASVASDQHMWMAKWQGIAGVACRSGKPQWATIWTEDPPILTFSERWMFQNEFRMWGFQLTRTANVRAVLSIPLVRKHGGSHNPRGKVVGVLNLDAVSTAGALWLADPEKREELLKFLSDHGGMLAFLD